MKFSKFRYNAEHGENSRKKVTIYYNRYIPVISLLLLLFSQTYFCGAFIHGQNTQLMEHMATSVELEDNFLVLFTLSIPGGMGELLTTYTAVLKRKKWCKIHLPSKRYSDLVIY